MLEITSIHEKQHFCLLFLLVILLCFFANNPCFSLKLDATSCFKDDRNFLLSMSQETRDCGTAYNRSYFQDCCSWPGVTCSNRTRRMTGLDLGLFLDECSVGAAYPIGPTRLRSSPISLTYLVSLQLDLDQETFIDGFSSFMHSFPNLRHLYLSSYQQPGIAIPKELGNLTRLETFEVHLYNTTYTSTLGMFSRLTSLKRLILSSVSLSRATDWVQIVGNLPRLEHLDLSNCYLPSTVYHSRLLGINSSKSLAYLDLSHNNLDASSTWSWIFNHTSLRTLSVSNNKLVGSIPNKFQRMTSLSHLDLSYNRLNGQLPSSLLGLCSISTLDLSQNHRLQGNLSRIFHSLSCANESLTVMSLQRNLFSGTLPDLSTFSRLSKLTLHSNRVNGSLPSTASNLTIFDVHNNQLTGSIPDLSTWTSLEVLKLQNNQLNGSIHPGVGQLQHLRHFDVSSNSLQGNLGIVHIANLSSLRYFDLSFNSLSLKIGTGWVPSFHLDTIGLASCDVGSRFPEWLRTQTDYSKLDLSNSGISDSIPFWFWNISSTATFISLSRNRLHGKLPTDSSLKFHMNPAIDLSFNSLEGTIPSYFGNTAYLNLSRNSFYGPVSFLCRNLDTLGIDLSHNNFSGNLPDCWSNFMGISVMDLSNNSFSGHLPSSFINLSYLRSLHLRSNKFSGKLPTLLCNLTYLLYLDLGDNLFTGDIPACLGNSLNNLTVLSLRNNSISGSIPRQLCNPSIQILDLSTNNISGEIPKCLCNLLGMTQKKSLPVVTDDSNGTFSTIGVPYKDYVTLVLKGYMYNDANHLELVKSLDLSGNNLRGEIPEEISCLIGLVSLNFSGNKLIGSVTSKIGRLTSLESLDLSNNRLSGEIPSSISDLNFLGTLSLANNNFSGKIPTGTQIQGFSDASFVGNPGLCGEPLTKKCPGDRDRGGYNVNAQSIEDDHDNDNDDRWFDLGLYISIALGFITGFWIFCGALVLKRSWRFAYFRFWTRVYDRLNVLVNAMLVSVRRR